MKQLPTEIIKLAHKTRSGELAWRKSDIPIVLIELKKLNYAILGGEAWAIKNNNIWGTIQCKDGNSGIFHWSVDHHDQENWDDYVVRSSEESLEAVNNLKVENVAIEKFKKNIYYNLSFVNQNEYDTQIVPISSRYKSKS